jgi:hypothetical protein
MEAHPDRPGLVDSLRGEGGELRRIFVTVAVCVLFVLALTATQAVFA